MKNLLAFFFFLSLALPQMAHADRLRMGGCEWQTVTDNQEWGTNYGEAISTAQVHGGTRSCVLTGSLGADSAIGFDHPIGTQTHVFVRWYLYIDDLPTETISTFLDLYSGATNVIALDITQSGGTYTVTPYYNNFGASLATFTVTPDTWNYIEVEYDSGPANGSEVFRVRLNGSVQSQATNLNFTTKNVTLISQGSYNGGASPATPIVYVDDVAVNNSSGSVQNSFPGEGKIAIAVPQSIATGACNNTAAAAAVAEVPPSTGQANNTQFCQLNTTTSLVSYAMTTTTGMGIDSFDTVSTVGLMAFVREASAGTSNWIPHISYNGAATTTGSTVDAGNTTPIANPNSTTAFGNSLFASVNPNTSSAWTPTEVDSMRCGAATTDGNPATHLLTLACFVEYVDGEAPPEPGGGGDSGVVWFD